MPKRKRSGSVGSLIGSLKKSKISGSKAGTKNKLKVKITKSMAPTFTGIKARSNFLRSKRDKQSGL